MRIFNSYTEKKESVDDSRIGIYVCGITPYDSSHLGHAFTFLVYDVLVRYLRFLGRNVTYVQNVTDIDDDILIKAKSLGISWRKLGKQEIKRHVENMDALNALRPDVYPKATDHITSMIRIIERLLKSGFAYEKNGSVYFEIKKDKRFGKLSKYDYRCMLDIANERGNFPLDPNKKDPLDFVLWQKQKPGEPAWDSPWGRGRPGWHIECSAMSMKYLGETITIHGGGEDLIFPHHEAEIAQSENSTGKIFAQIFMHTALVYCDGKKMSKSLGNMIFVHDLLKNYSPNTIRIFLLSHHWRQAFNYEEKELKEAQGKAMVLEEAARKSSGAGRAVQKLLPEFFEAMDNNLDIPRAIAILVRLAKSKSPKSYELIAQCGQILGLAFEI